jgi:hypothetical protein
MREGALDEMCDLIQEDVGKRGLRTDPNVNLVTACVGDFQAACRGLAETPKAAVGIVTGFFIPHAQPAAGETDGPLGALFLARALVPLDIRVVIATDWFCVPALAAGLAACGLEKDVMLVELPSTGDHYGETFARQAGRLTHLIALERVGPSHTPHSIRSQAGTTEEHLENFLGEVPAESHDRCHSMRGRDITPHMSPAHLLFEEKVCPGAGIRTIGIGDGGNEIGMGNIPWHVIRGNIPGGGLVACRVPVDQLVVCGISNWGAYGLATGVRWLRGEKPDPELFDVARERALLEIMVKGGPLVDGVTGLPTISVDGLEFDRYAQPLLRLGEIDRRGRGPAS